MIAGVLLAAGESKRMGRPKALVRHEGWSFAARGIRHLWTACDLVVTVLGAEARRIRREIEREFEEQVGRGSFAGDLLRAHAHGAAGLETHFVVNPRWRRGMLLSARVGLAEALRSRPEAVLLLPVDHPGVKPETVASLAEMMREAMRAFARPARAHGGFAYALVPRHGRRRGHPVALSPGLARAVIADPGAADLSDAIRRNARLVGYLDVRDAGVVTNRNTPRG